MSKLTFAITAIIAAFFSLPFSPKVDNPVYDANAVKRSAALSCTPDRMAIAALLAANDEINLLPGSGNYKWKIDTKSDSAQLYFNQGINMYYGFHIIESIASFKKAAKFDDSNPMIWWAQALAAGPNINDAGYTASPEAIEVAKKALDLSNASTPVEKALMQAMSVRYSTDSTVTRESLNQAYADAMKKVYQQFPDNVDVMTLYADALMLQHPWDLWDINGHPKPWQPEIQEILEKVIAKDPMHPGGNHYYIHIVEASPTPEKALHSAEVLGKITPGLSHLVHMPSHIHLRLGNYDVGVQNNEAAVKQFKDYGALFPASNANAFIYYWHNLHMLANCAMLAGKYPEAISAADELKVALDTATLSLPAPIGSLVHYLYSTPVLVNIRFEKWDDLLKVSKPDEKYVYANVLYHFGRGMAFAGKKNIANAKKEADAMRVLMNDSTLTIPMTPFSAAIEGAAVAYDMLNGSIAFQSKNIKEAINHFEAASEREWNMVYNEPRDWILNPHQYLGNAYLAAKNYRKAEEAFRKDLKKNNKNVWSVRGLEQSMKAQGRRS